MSTVQKVALAIVGVAAITTLVLPGRQSPAVINAIGGSFDSSLGTAITGNTPKG
jgi:hypothetical protein